MNEYKRIFVIVLDSLGIGAMPDSKKFGDEGVRYIWTYFGKNGHIGDSKSAKIRNVKFAFGREDGKSRRTKRTLYETW